MGVREQSLVIMGLKKEKAIVKKLKAVGRKLSHILPDKLYLKMKFRHRIGKRLNLKNPQTFNEKTQWLKLYDRKPIYNTMVDKCEAKSYVAERIGEEYIIPTYGVYDSFDEIDFDSLPDQFVIKCTHDSGGCVICKNKAEFDIEAARKKITQLLKKNFYWHGREWPYKDLKPRVIVEKYIIDEQLQELRDYKFFCFDGVAKYLKIDFDRFTFHRANYYNAYTGELLEFGELQYPRQPERDIKMPPNLDKMRDFAEKLSKGFPFLRVDFYDVNGKVYFGELTFYSSCGFSAFTDFKWDYELGSMIKLPIDKEN